MLLTIHSQGERKCQQLDNMSTESHIKVKSAKAVDEGGILQALEFSQQGHEEYAAGKPLDALKLMNESLTIVDRLLPDSPEVAEVLSSIGFMRQEAGIGNGFQYHWRALQIRLRDQPNTTFEAESQEHVGMSLLSEHHFGAALRHLTKALSFHESKNPSSFLTAIQHIHVGQAQENVGQLQEAIGSFERALLIFAGLKLDSLEVANARCLIGRVLRQQGNFKAAKKQLIQAIVMYDAKAPASLDLANACVELGRLHGLEQGNRKTGMAFFSKALEIQKAIAPNSLEVANTFHHVAVSHASVGNPEVGQLYLLGAISIRESLAPNSLDLARSLYVMGELLEKQGRYKSSLGHHKRALKLRSRTQPLTLDQSDSFHAIGNVLENMGNWEEALGYYSREFVDRDIDAVETARVHNIIGNILLRETMRFRDAVYNQRMAVRIQTRHGRSVKLAKYLTDLITALNANGESTADVEKQLDEVRKSLASLPAGKQLDKVRMPLASFSGAQSDRVHKAFSSLPELGVRNDAESAHNQESMSVSS